MYNHYIRKDSNDLVIKAFSDAFESSQGGDINVQSDTQDRHFNIEIFDTDGLYNYKYDDSPSEPTGVEIIYGVIVERSDTEKRPLQYLKDKKKEETNRVCTQRINDTYPPDKQRSVALGIDKYTGTGSIDVDLKQYITDQVARSDEINIEIDVLTTRQEVIDYVIDFDTTG